MAGHGRGQEIIQGLHNPAAIIFIASPTLKLAAAARGPLRVRVCQCRVFRVVRPPARPFPDCRLQSLDRDRPPLSLFIKTPVRFDRFDRANVAWATPYVRTTVFGHLTITLFRIWGKSSEALPDTHSINGGGPCRQLTLTMSEKQLWTETLVIL